MSLISKGALDIRKRTVHEGRCDQCAMCNKEYDILGVLRYHKRTVHDGRNSYCDVCEKEYRSKENLRAHMRTIHHKISFVASTIKNNNSIFVAYLNRIQYKGRVSKN